MVTELLQKKGDLKPLGVNQIQKFLRRHPNIKSIYIPPLDKEQVIAQEPEILYSWFKLYKSIKRQYQVKDKDIYNMDKKGFIQGVVTKLRVIISKHERKTTITQYGNREQVSLIKCISIDRRILKPWVIFKAKQQQKAQHEVLKEGYIAVSKNGWTDNELGLIQLEWCFTKETAVDQKGEYRILILDGHASYISTAAIEFYISQKTILLYLPAHITHLL